MNICMRPTDVITQRKPNPRKNMVSNAISALLCYFCLGWVALALCRLLDSYIFRKCFFYSTNLVLRANTLIRVYFKCCDEYVRVWSDCVLRDCQGPLGHLHCYRCCTAAVMGRHECLCASARPIARRTIESMAHASHCVDTHKRNYRSGPSIVPVCAI